MYINSEVYLADDLRRSQSIYDYSSPLILSSDDEIILSSDEDTSNKNDDNQPDNDEETSEHTEFYNILGLPPTATQNELKSSYRKLTVQYHPDKNPYGGERFKKISMVYNVLSNPEKICWLKRE